MPATNDHGNVDNIPNVIILLTESSYLDGRIDVAGHNKRDAQQGIGHSQLGKNGREAEQSQPDKLSHHERCRVAPATAALVLCVEPPGNLGGALS